MGNGCRRLAWRAAAFIFDALADALIGGARLARAGAETLRARSAPSETAP